MTKVVSVNMPLSSAELWYDAQDLAIKAGDSVVVSGERGDDSAVATRDVFEATDKEIAQKTGHKKLSRVLRIMTEEDKQKERELNEDAQPHFAAVKEVIAELGLNVKLVALRYAFDGHRLVCYFSSDERIDFRELIKKLGARLHEHVELRQMNAREEAALEGGYSTCGEELCCALWQREARPVSIKMAKDQDLALNSPKISGACGRLMCCLRFEDEAYAAFKKQAPKRNAKIQTPLGEAKVVGYCMPKNLVELRIEESGKRISVNLADMSISEQAQKQADKRHITARPDEIKREALEAMESLDIEMALRQLDGPGSFVAREDLFVSLEPETKARSRKRRNTQTEQDVPVQSTQSAQRSQHTQPAQHARPAQHAQHAQHAQPARRSQKKNLKTRDVRPGRATRIRRHKNK